MRQRERASEQRPERIGLREAALVVGVPTRTITRMAVRGEIPGAAQFGRTWTFNEERLRAWIRAAEEEIAATGEWCARRRALVASVRVQTSVAPPWDIRRQYDDAMESLLHPPRAAS